MKDLLAEALYPPPSSGMGPVAQGCHRSHVRERRFTTGSVSTELAWAAGFFDGEGCVSLGKSRSKKSRFMYASPHLLVWQVDKRPLERFHEAVQGLGKLTGPHPPKQNGHIGKQDIYLWRATKRTETQAVIDLLWDYMSEPKREKVLEVWSGMGRHVEEVVGQEALSHMVASP